MGLGSSASCSISLNTVLTDQQQAMYQNSDCIHDILRTARTIAIVGLSADRQKATVKVRISFLKLDPRILPDMGIKVTFLGAEPERNNGAARAAAMIPQDAVHD